jgi:hypothetical protein
MSVLSGCGKTTLDAATTEARLKRIKEFNIILDYQKALSANMQTVLGILSVLQNNISNSQDTQVWKDNTRAAAARLKTECAKGKALVAPAEYKEQRELYGKSLDKFDQFATKMIEYLDIPAAEESNRAIRLKDAIDAVIAGGDILKQATDVQDKLEVPLFKELSDLLKSK